MSISWRENGPEQSRTSPRAFFSVVPHSPNILSDEEPMILRDYFTETMRRKGKAEEDQYFARIERKLIEELRRQRERFWQDLGLSAPHPGSLLS